MSRFLNALHLLPWVAAERITVAYEPKQKPRTGVSWYYPKGESDALRAPPAAASRASPASPAPPDTASVPSLPRLDASSARIGAAHDTRVLNRVPVLPLFRSFAPAALFSTHANFKEPPPALASPSPAPHARPYGPSPPPPLSDLPLPAASTVVDARTVGLSTTSPRTASPGLGRGPPAAQALPYVHPTPRSQHSGSGSGSGSGKTHPHAQMLGLGLTPVYMQVVPLSPNPGSNLAPPGSRQSQQVAFVAGDVRYPYPYGYGVGVGATTAYSGGWSGNVESAGSGSPFAMPAPAQTVPG